MKKATQSRKTYSQELKMPNKRIKGPVRTNVVKPPTQRTLDWKREMYFIRSGQAKKKNTKNIDIWDKA